MLEVTLARTVILGSCSIVKIFRSGGFDFLPSDLFFRGNINLDKPFRGSFILGAGWHIRRLGIGIVVVLPQYLFSSVIFTLNFVRSVIVSCRIVVVSVLI